MTNVVATNEMVVASTKDCKNPRSELTTIDLALLLVLTDDCMLRRDDDVDVLQITTLILFCLRDFSGGIAQWFAYQSPVTMALFLRCYELGG